MIILLLSDSATIKAGRFLVADVSENGKGTKITSPFTTFSIGLCKLHLPLDQAKFCSIG